jgi:hypothetical protein
MLPNKKCISGLVNAFEMFQEINEKKKKKRKNYHNDKKPCLQVLMIV